MAGYGLFSAGQQNAKVLLTGRYVHIFEGVIFQSDMRRKFSNRLRVFKFGHFSFTPIPTCASGSSLVRESQIPRNHLDGHADFIGNRTILGANAPLVTFLGGTQAVMLIRRSRIGAAAPDACHSRHTRLR